MQNFEYFSWQPTDGLLLLKIEQNKKGRRMVVTLELAYWTRTKLPDAFRSMMTFDDSFFSMMTDYKLWIFKKTFFSKTQTMEFRLKCTFSDDDKSF